MKFSSEPTPEQLADLNLGAKFQSLQAPLTADIEKLKRQTEQVVYTAIAQHTLTPEQALQAWYEHLSYHRLLQRFNQRIKIGEAAGNALQPLTGEPR